MNMNLHQAQSHDILRSWQSQRNDINHRIDFVLPMFIGNDDDQTEPIDSMPDVYRYGCNTAIDYLEPLVNKYGLRSVLLFPVVTKSDRTRLDSGDVSDDEDEGGMKSNSSQYSTHSSSSSSKYTDDDDERTAGAERLMPLGGDSTGSQNPFLNQNEEEDHLLAGEQMTDVAEVSNQSIGDNNGQSMKSMPPPIAAPAPPPRASETMKKFSRAQDVKLIKGMALKDKFNPVLRLIPKLRSKFPNLLIICDVCLCAFTSTGHCCLFDDHLKVRTANCLNSSSKPTSKLVSANDIFPISNKITCQYLAMLSVEYAQRGCNVIAPSDMMDGRILTIREKLNENGLQHVSILSYSAKFASAFYGPFRQATDNAPEFGDRRAYQLPPGSRALAMKAVERDIKEGADFVMVKPAGAYLDIVRDIRENHSQIPIAVYQVSGEYSMIKVAAKAGVIDLKLAVNESLTAFRRAGATIIISYFTPELLRGQLSTSDM